MILKNEEILFEDNHLLIVNKRAGLLVQNDETGDVSLVDLARDYLKKKYNKPGNIFIGLPHRIDRPVSGLVILCKTSKSLTRITQAFKAKHINKTYWAIVTNKPPFTSGKLIHWLKKNNRLNKVTLYLNEHQHALKSELNYELIQEYSGYFLLKINPLTGRSHQIRAQLSKINCPIAGDVKYGALEKNYEGNIYLHAKIVEFLHPVKLTPVYITAPVPNKGLWNLFKQFQVNGI